MKVTREGVFSSTKITRLSITPIIVDSVGKKNITIKTSTNEYLRLKSYSLEKTPDGGSRKIEFNVQGKYICNFILCTGKEKYSETLPLVFGNNSWYKLCCFFDKDGFELEGHSVYLYIDEGGMSVYKHVIRPGSF